MKENYLTTIEKIFNIIYCLLSFFLIFGTLYIIYEKNTILGLIIIVLYGYSKINWIETNKIIRRKEIENAVKNTADFYKEKINEKN